MPAERLRFVQVVVEVVEHDHGHWCRPCALPSGIRATLAVRSDAGMHLQNRVWCRECGSSDVEVNPDGYHC